MSALLHVAVIAAAAEELRDLDTDVWLQEVGGGFFIVHFLSVSRHTCLDKTRLRLSSLDT